MDILVRVIRNRAAAMRIGTGDLGVGRHPIVGMRHALFGRQQRQERRQRIDRERLSRRERQVLAFELEVVAGLVVADHRTIGGNDLHLQVIEDERVARCRGPACGHRVRSSWNPSV